MARIISASLLALGLLLLGAAVWERGPAAAGDRLLLAELNAEEGAAFRRDYRANEGVLSLPSGLLVRLLETGAGEVPTAEDHVTVHYRGMHADGRVFEDSHRRGEPTVVPVERMIPGWREAVLGLPVGSRVEVVLPPELAYGRAGAGPVGPEETLVFELELLAIAPAPEAPPERPADQQAVPGL